MTQENTQNPFMNPGELSLGDAFLEKGYIIQDVEDREALERIQGAIAGFAAEFLGMDTPADITGFLNTVHERVSVDDLNSFRVHVINNLKQQPWLMTSYFSLVKNALGAIVGNELAMQRGVGLSVQMPNDESSLLPIHADVWDGDSPYEVVVWTPLVDCYKTKSMFILPIKKDRDHAAIIPEIRHRPVSELYSAVEKDVEFLDIKFGQVMVFSQTVMHGNIINSEQETRWSLNCRFKSLMSPYWDKRFGEFFEPISLRPATRIGLDYVLPE